MAATDIVETLLDLANEIEGGEHVKCEDAAKVMRGGAEVIEILRSELGGAISLLIQWRAWGKAYADCAKREPISALDVKTAELLEDWRDSQ
jgi:hypothetical protein